MMKIAYFDCVAGVSGDMMLGAILDAGVRVEDLSAALSSLPVNEFRLEARKVYKNGFGATKVDVSIHDEAHARHVGDILELVNASHLGDGIKADACAVFTRIGEEEAKIHGMSFEDVHLHEVGGMDTIVDVCGVLIGLDMLGVKASWCSPLPLARGFVRGAHGMIPLPAPAALAILQGVPVQGSSVEAELVTPTGAALVTRLAKGFGPLPAMILESVGYGAGARDLVIPNVFRLLVGEACGDPNYETQRLTVLESNLDDETGEALGAAAEKLRKAGALDVWFSHVQMKKNRPGMILHVLSNESHNGILRDILFRETGTLGIREYEVARHALKRSRGHVHVEEGVAHVKFAFLGDGSWKCAPEFADCEKLAESSGHPVREIYQRVYAAALAAGPPDAGMSDHEHPHHEHPHHEHPHHEHPHHEHPHNHG